MSTFNAYMSLVIGFVLLLFLTEIENRARQKKIEERRQVKIREIEIKNEQARKEAIELAKCRVRVPHDGNPKTNTAKVELTALAEDSDKKDKVRITWTQTAGKTVKLNPDNKSSKINFTGTPGEYVFQVKASDRYGNQTDTITVKILPELNQLPDVEIQCPI